MKKLFTLFVFTGLISFTPLFALSGGPDAYGYVWKDSNEPGGPVYNWIDISTIGLPITGLADDNSAPMQYNIGFNFHYYWSDYTKVKVGSNGWVSFDNPSNIASCFPSLPTAGGPADNILAAFMTDLTFFGGGNPAQAFYWTNFTDSFIVQYSNVPHWMAAAPNYTAGTTTFQIILCGSDSSITFQYQTLNTLNDIAGCNDLVIGIENLTGNIGLQCYVDLVPPANYAIKFYYPPVVTLQVPDATPFWNQNVGSKGVIVPAGSISLATNIKNVGNATISSPIAINAQVRDLAFVLLHQDNDTLASLNTGAFTIVNFLPAYLTVPGQYSYQVSTNCATDINPANNIKLSEIEVINACSPTVFTYHTPNLPDQQVSWNSGIGNDDGIGVFYKPPVYPILIDSLEFFVQNALGDGYTATIFANDAPFGAPGTILSSTVVPGASVITASWNSVDLLTPVQIDSGGFYVVFFQAGPNIFLGLETAAPISRNTYEILDGSWSEYRENSNQDAAFKVHITPPGLDNSTSVVGITITANQAGATYQWLDCNNSYAVIPGATAQNFMAPANGSYAVQLNFAGCLDTSACVVINNFSIENWLLNNAIVFPNPAESIVNIQFIYAVSNDPVYLQLTDVAGKNIAVPYQMNLDNLQLNVEALSSGIYTYQLIQNGNIFAVGKFVKQ